MNLVEKIKKDGRLLSPSIERIIEGLDISPIFDVFIPSSCSVIDEIILRYELNMESYLTIMISFMGINCITLNKDDIQYRKINKCEINNSLFTFMNKHYK